MKRSRYQLQLDNPCQKSWEDMTPSASGRFCQHCAKQVLDLTTLSDDQLLGIIRKSEAHFCGRVTGTQLNRYLVDRTESSLTSRLFRIFAGLFLFASTDSTAQNLIERQPTPLVQLPTGQERIAAEQEHDPAFSQKARVRAQLISAETQQPVPRAYVSLMPPPTNGYSRGGTTAISDAEGYFEIPIPDSLIDQPARLVIVHPDHGLKRIALGAGPPPEVIELLPPPPPVAIMGGGLVVVKRKWWQFWQKKECSK